MKKFFLRSAVVLSMAVGFVSLTSCDRIQDAVNEIEIPVPFLVEPNINPQTIPYASIPTDFYYSIPVTLNLDLDQEIKNEIPALSIENLKSAKLEKMNIILLESTLNADLGTISSAKLYLKTPELEKVLVATADGDQITEDRIDFTAVGNEIAEYFQSTENSLIIDVKGSEVSVGKLTLDINPSFRVKVGP